MRDNLAGDEKAKQKQLSGALVPKRFADDKEEAPVGLVRSGSLVLVKNSFPKCEAQP
jgi:hypothetical protein